MNNIPPKRIELLAPAGNFEKLEIAIHYGADAVYLGGKDFSLRNVRGNFTVDEIREAIAYAHDRNVKIYVACNIYPRNRDIEPLADYLKQLAEIEPDALIVSDPGIVMLAQEISPQIPIHLSTQANTTNSGSVKFWAKQGVSRINLARELTLSEVQEVASQTTIEIEVFIHGAMCISYSGRCLLSSFMANRSSNQGLCCHPCRFSYAVMEMTRPGQYFPIVEDDRGSYIFNSKDLCMIEHIPEIIQAGVASLKIEGRMKGIHYVASAVKTYREALDAYYENPETWEARREWIEELNKISYRGYCTGFYFNDPTQTLPNYETSHYTMNHFVFIGKILEKVGTNRFRCEMRNKTHKGDSIEILSPKGKARKTEIIDIFDLKGNSVDFAQNGYPAVLTLDVECTPHDLLRRI